MIGEENNMSEKYYLGLDMGTDSVGWAVTDTSYHLLREKGKDFWGVREFDEASTAKDRRTKRTQRRKYQRRKVREGLLKSYFAEAVDKIDPQFFQRLDNSKYWMEDKDASVRTPNGVFNDPGYTDKEYFRQYPTIFHLRMELINNPAPHDVRLVYLAILNMFKHRGNFLNPSLDPDNLGANIDEVYETMCAALTEYTDIALPAEMTGHEIVFILSRSDYSRSDKAKDLTERWNIDKKAPVYFLIRLLCGLKVDARKLFEDIPEGDEKIEIDFNASDFENRSGDLENQIGSDYMEIIFAAKQLYDLGVLQNVLKGEKYLSEARVKEYQQHKEDLRLLKKAMKKYCTMQEYNQMFRAGEAGSYSAYVNSYNSDTAANKKAGHDAKLRRNMGSAAKKQADLYKKIKDLLKENQESDPDVKKILDAIDKGTFLPKQLTSANGVIPNQVHAKELAAVLDNAEKYLPFLLEKDESGLTVSERIKKLFSFRVPYYIGPVTERSKNDGGNGWVKRIEGGQVLPWNINQKIDMKKTSAEFVNRMIRRCTYINSEQVLPKQSLLYQKFCVLNEINNLTINDVRIPVQLKQDIYHSLYEKGKKVTVSQIFRYLHSRGLAESKDQLGGMDEKQSDSLTSYGKFTAIFGERMKEDEYWDLAEDIIYWCTLYGESKSFLREQLNEKYGDRLTNEQMNRILGLKFSDWGRMSREFLELPGVDQKTGEVTTLIRTMWDTNQNLMELLNNEEYTFRDELQKRQTTALLTLADIKPEDFDQYYFSAPVKRMMWQTILLIREIEHIMGAAPARIFVETAREHEKNPKRKEDRASMFRNLCKSIIKDDPKWDEIIKNAEESGTIRSKKMYLYLTQMGMDMYTGEAIDLDKLFDNNVYDIDHIYPQQVVKDDNLSNNCVLVRKQKNAQKSNLYPIEYSIRKNMQPKWKNLLDKKLITQEKYHRLSNDQPFTEYQLSGFISRQIVETNQGVKGMADLLKQLMPESTLVYSKAKNVTEFRNQYDIYKSRLLNDYHHANDAYLNIVVVNAYYVKFTNNPINFIHKYMQDKEKYKYHLNKMFESDIIRGDEVAWIAFREGNPGTISIVKKTCQKNTPLVTRRTFEEHGSISNATIRGRRTAKAGSYLPIKTSDDRLRNVEKYGGYEDISTSYFFLVEHTVKGKRVRTLQTVPVYLKTKLQSSKDALEKYCNEDLHLLDPSVRIEKIPINSLLCVNGYYLRITGKTNKYINTRNATAMCLNHEKFQDSLRVNENDKLSFVDYVKKIEKYHDTNIMDVLITKEKNIALYQILTNKHKSTIFSKRPNPMAKTLDKLFDAFCGLTRDKQLFVLWQIINLTGQIVPRANLKLIGGGEQAGIMLISSQISNNERIELITQSITGIFEKRINLLTV